MSTECGGPQVPLLTLHTKGLQICSKQLMFFPSMHRNVQPYCLTLQIYATQRFPILPNISDNSQSQKKNCKNLFQTPPIICADNELDNCSVRENGVWDAIRSNYASTERHTAWCSKHTKPTLRGRCQRPQRPPRLGRPRRFDAKRGCSKPKPPWQTCWIFNEVLSKMGGHPGLRPRQPPPKNPIWWRGCSGHWPSCPPFSRYVLSPVLWRQEARTVTPVPLLTTVWKACGLQPN